MSDEIYYDEERNVIPMPLDEWKIHCAQKENEGKIWDSNGVQLEAGDTIIAIKPLPVKGGVTIQKGEKFTKIKMTNEPGHVLAKHPKNGEIYLKTEFFRKV